MTIRVLLAVFLFVFASLFEVAGKPPVNRDAHGIANAMPKFNPKANKGQAEGQMKRLISMLAATNRDSLSSNTALMKKAMDFRDDIGDQQKICSSGAVLKAWEAAFAYGAINERNQFTGRATRGRYDGEKLVFENIVRPEALPQCAGYIGNLRLVPISMARKKEEPIDVREEGYAMGLKKVMHEAKSYAAMLEIEKSKVGKLAYDKGEKEEKYQAEVAEAGEMVHQKPNLRLIGQRLSTPSKMNGNRYRVRFEVQNLSRHPTEIEVEYTIVGYTDNDNKLYEMKRESETLKLRRSEVHSKEVWTPNVSVFSKPLKIFDPKKSTKIYYRGYMIRADFKGETIATTGSDGRLMRVASGEYSDPPGILHLGKKKSK